MKKVKVIASIIEAFEEIGYTVSMAILESAEFGVPQLRSRAILIGNRHNLFNPFTAPLLDNENYVPIEKGFVGLSD